jgi:hypothetical protein
MYVCMYTAGGKGSRVIVVRGELSDVSGTCYLNDRAAYVRIPHRRSLECGHIEKAVYIGRESVADIRPLGFVSDVGRGAQGVCLLLASHLPSCSWFAA